MKKGVLITGGTGLIGQALADSLTGDGHEVIVLSRNPRGTTGLPDSVRVDHWDAHTAEGWGHLVENVDAIINLAGENIAAGRWTAKRKRRIIKSRVNDGQAVVQAVESAARKPQVVSHRLGSFHCPGRSLGSSTSGHPHWSSAQQQRWCSAPHVIAFSPLYWRAFRKWTAMATLDPYS